MKSVKNEDWYANTLFVIVADHSHNSPRNWRVAQMERFKIPMLWFGEVLKPNYKGSKWDKLSSHIDITPTILEQLGQDNTSYKFGRNILNIIASIIRWTMIYPAQFLNLRWMTT